MRPRISWEPGSQVPRENPALLDTVKIFGTLEKSFSIEFIAIYATIFSVLSVVFSYYWRKYFNRGPFELVMRKLTG